MNYSFEATEDFAKQLKAVAQKYKSIRSDILKLQQSIVEQPDQGVDLGGGFRKIRCAIQSKNKGKSSGGRVITYETLLSVVDKKIIFVAIYDKSQYSTVDLDLI